MEEQIQSSWSKFLDKLSGWVDAVILNLPNLLLALIVFILAVWLSRNLESLVNKALKKVIKQVSVRSLVSTVASVLVVLLGLILALSILNLDGTIKSLLASAGVTGLAVGLALQGTLANTFSGVFLAIKDELNVGDWVETNGYKGRIVEIELRNTKLKEADNNIVVIPNKIILEHPFKNYGLTKRIRMTITCGVGYESDLKEVKDLSIKTLKDLYEPSHGENVEFYYTNFGDSSVDFMLRFWVDAQENLTALEVKSNAIMAIKQAFDNNNINIPFPIRTVFMNDALKTLKDED